MHQTVRLNILPPFDADFGMAPLLCDSSRPGDRYIITLLKGIIVICCLSYPFFINPAQAQWAFSVGLYNEDVAVDEAGNVLLTGQFAGTADFDPGPDSTKLSSPGTFSDFVAKYTAGGSFLWAASTESEAGIGITSDEAQNVYVTGISYSSAFVAKFDVDGTLQWRFNLGGTASPSPFFNRAQDIAVDKYGTVYVTGFFSGTVDFDPGSGTAELTSAGSQDAFIAKYDTDGNYDWSFGLGGSTHTASGTSLGVDREGNVYVTGHFTGESDFDPGPDTAELISSEIGGVQLPDAFLAKYDASGGLRWVFNIATASEKGPHLTLDALGNIHITGTFRNNADFDPGAGTVELTPAGLESAFLAKYNSDGQYEWAIAVEGTSTAVVPVINSFAVDVDDGGSNYITGLLRGSADFNPGPDTAELRSTEGAVDIFVAKYDADGNYLWAFIIGSADSDEGRGIAVDHSEGVYVTGFVLGGSADFDPGEETFILTGRGFLAKYNTSGGFAVDVEDARELPQEYTFSAAYPNPFDQTTSFTLTLLHPQPIRVETFDLIGRRIELLYAGFVSVGTHHFKFSASALPMGCYVIRATGERFFATQKVLLVR